MNSTDLLILLHSADVKEKLSDEAQNKLDEAADNFNQAEKMADEAYKEFWNTCNEIAQKLIQITYGQIDKQTAFKMATEKREDIIKLLNK